MSLQLILANAARIPKYRFYFGERGIRIKIRTTYKEVENMSWFIPSSSLVCSCVVRIKVGKKYVEGRNGPRSILANTIDQHRISVLSS